VHLAASPPSGDAAPRGRLRRSTPPSLPPRLQTACESDPRRSLLEPTRRQECDVKTGFGDSAEAREDGGEWVGVVTKYLFEGRDKGRD
jgi:hypothetical protein